jgi:beta-phosphoglucomutase-like phosphatase (HAD superfamily)
MRLEAAVFDLDGTILDIESAELPVWPEEYRMDHLWEVVR